METELKAMKNSQTTYCFENLGLFRVFAVIPSEVHGRACAEEGRGHRKYKDKTSSG